MDQDKIDESRRRFLKGLVNMTDTENDKEDSSESIHGYTVESDEDDSSIKEFKIVTYNERMLKSQETIERYTKAGVISAIINAGLVSAAYLKEVLKKDAKGDLKFSDKMNHKQEEDLTEVARLLLLSKKNSTIKVFGKFKYQTQTLKYFRRQGCLNPLCQFRNKEFEMTAFVKIKYPIDFKFSKASVLRKAYHIRIPVIGLSVFGNEREIPVLQEPIQKENTVKILIHDQICNGESFRIRLVGFDELGNTLIYTSPSIQGDLDAFNRHRIK